MPDMETPQPGEGTQIKRVCQVIVAFECDTDEEAMSVKAAIDNAMLPFPDAQVTFTSRNFKRTVPMLRR